MLINLKAREGPHSKLRLSGLNLIAFFMSKESISPFNNFLMVVHISFMQIASPIPFCIVREVIL